GLDFRFGRANRLRLPETPCDANRNVVVVAYGRIYLSIQIGSSRCRLVAFNSATGARVAWNEPVPSDGDIWDLPFAAINHEIYFMRLNTDYISGYEPLDPTDPWHALDRVDARTGQPISWTQSSFNNEILAIAPAGDTILVA